MWCLKKCFIWDVKSSKISFFAEGLLYYVSYFKIIFCYYKHCAKCCQLTPPHPQTHSQKIDYSVGQKGWLNVVHVALFCIMKVNGDGNYQALRRTTKKVPQKWGQNCLFRWTNLLTQQRGWYACFFLFHTLLQEAVLWDRELCPHLAQSTIVPSVSFEEWGLSKGHPTAPVPSDPVCPRSGCSWLGSRW